MEATYRRRRAVLGLCITLAAGVIAALLVIAPWKAADEHVLVAMPFTAEPDGSVILVGIGSGDCGGDHPSIEKIDVLKRDPSILLRASVAYSKGFGPDEYKGGCPDILLLLEDEVDIGEPVGDRPIYDAYEQPPVKRWPDGVLP